MDARTDDSMALQKQQTPWRLLALLIAMTAIGPVCLNILVPALPSLATLLDADIGTVQLTLSLFLLSLATAQLMLGPLSDRFGRRPVVLAGLIIATVAPLAATVAGSIHMLIIARIAQAFGAATGVVIGRTIVRDLYERDRAAAMIGLVTTAMVIAPMFAPTIGGVLDTAFGWQSIFLFSALFSGIVLVWATRALPETMTARGADANLLRDWRALAGSAQFHGYVLCGALGTAPFFTFIGGGPHVVVSLMGRTSAEYGLWFAVTSIGYMTGNFLASRLSQRLGVNRMIVDGFVVQLIGAIVGVALVGLWSELGPVVIFAPQIIISIGNGMLLPNAIAGAVSVRPHAAGAASGIAGFAQMSIGALMAQLVTLALAGAATALPMALMILVESVAGAAIFVTLVRR